MTGSPAAFTVKSPVLLKFGEALTRTSRPGVFVVDIAFPHGQAVNIQEISFKNYYTAFLMVRMQMRNPGQEGSPKWFTCLRNHRLMPNPHTEDGSQDYCSLSRQQMLTDPDGVTAVRLVLRQPSSAWLNFTLEEIQIHPCGSEDSERAVPDCLSRLSPVDEPDLQGLPDPETVSSSLQQMWALTEVMQTHQTAAPIGRFDVDGCYDVKLLSYT